MDRRRTSQTCVPRSRRAVRSLTDDIDLLRNNPTATSRNSGAGL
jgi:hypothetical protein